jgi:hypothetical protein
MAADMDLQDPIGMAESERKDNGSFFGIASHNSLKQHPLTHIRYT